MTRYSRPPSIRVVYYVASGIEVGNHSTLRHFVRKEQTSKYATVKLLYGGSMVVSYFNALRDQITVFYALLLLANQGYGLLDIDVDFYCFEAVLNLPPVSQHYRTCS